MFSTEQIPWRDIGLGIGLPGCAALFAVLVYFRRRMQAQKSEDEAWVAKWSELKIHRKEEEKEKDKDKKKLAQLAAATKKDPETVSGASMGASMGGMSKRTFCQEFDQVFLIEISFAVFLGMGKLKKNSEIQGKFW